MSLSRSNSPKYSTKKIPPRPMSPVVPSQQQSSLSSSSSTTSLLGAKELQEQLHILLSKLATTTKIIQTWPSEQQTSGGGDSSSSIHVETTTKLIESINQLIIALENVEGTIKTNTILKKELQSCQVPINLLDLLDHGNGLNPDCFSRGLLREALGQLAGLKRRKLALEMLGAAVQAGLDQKDIAIGKQQKAEGEKSDMDVVDNNADDNKTGRLSHDDTILVFDGGTGREIERHGGPFRQPEWSALALYDDPSIVQKVHESFIDAGATAITTNTYAVVPFHIGQVRYDKDGKRLLQLAIDMAHKAINAKQRHQKIQILGSIPPLCGSYEPELFNEAVAKPMLVDFLNVFCKANMNQVDILLLETVGSYREAKFYLQEIRNMIGKDNSMPIWLSFCVKAEFGYEQKPELLSGEKISSAIQMLSTEGLLENVQVILINCCDVRLVRDSIKEMKRILKQEGIESQIRIGAYPNAFSVPPPDAANQTLRQVDYNITPDVLKCQTVHWIECGARVIGGCCGVNPDHIHAIASLTCQQNEAISTN